MSIFGSYDHVPRILERKPELVDLQIRNRLPEVTGYRLWGSRTPMGLWGTTTTLVNSGMGAAGAALNLRQQLFRTDAGVFYRSPEIRRRRLLYDEVHRGGTRMVFSIKDFIAPAAPQPLPNDQQFLFVAVQQERRSLGGGPVVVQGAVDTGEDILGPILVVPYPSFFTMMESTLLIQASAPGATLGTTVFAGLPPVLDMDYQNPNPLHLVLPFPTTSITVRNLDGIEGLYFSYDLGQPMVFVPAGEDRTHFGAVKDIVLASQNAANACLFSIEANINLGANSGT